MEQEFKLVGLSKPKTIVCETEKQDTFRPNTDKISQDRFDALWQLMDGNWGNAKAIIRYDGIVNDMPINAVFIAVTEI